MLAALVQVDSRQNRLGDARVRVRAARDANPGDARLQLLYGELAAEAGQRDEAEAAFRKPIEVDPNQLAAYSRLVLLLITTQPMDEGVAI